MKPFIGLKRLWYTDSMTTAPTAATLKTLIAGTTMTEVKNVHQDTWKYEQDDADTTDYINELNGKIYHQDKTKDGKKTISFTLGEYSFEDKAALQGGEVIEEDTTVTGWKAPSTMDLIYKAIVAETKTGNYVVFTNANIMGKVDTQEKNLGLGISAVANENSDNTISDEYWFDGTKVNV